MSEATPDDFEHYAVGFQRTSFAFLSTGARTLEPGGAMIRICGGSSRRAFEGRGAWAAGMFATRALTQAAALELRPKGIHAALLIVDGTIQSPKTEQWTKDAPDDSLVQQADVARAALYLATQPPSAWTYELQITPRGDNWNP
jgi:NAD(P)-dependent dehydrogenase (short-subunit alcohol dehydrogenase family)